MFNVYLYLLWTFDIYYVNENLKHIVEHLKNVFTRRRSLLFRYMSISLDINFFKYLIVIKLIINCYVSIFRIDCFITFFQICKCELYFLKSEFRLQFLCV